MASFSKRKALMCAASVAALVFFFGIQTAKAESKNRTISLPAYVPIQGDSEVQLPYPPGPDFSWFRKDNLRLDSWIDSRPAASSSDTQKLVAGASPTLGRIPWYLRALFVILVVILFAGSYFYYRYSKSRRLINSLAE